MNLEILENYGSSEAGQFLWLIENRIALWACGANHFWTVLLLLMRQNIQ